MELTGRIIDIMEAKSGKAVKTGNPWMMQEYVIEVPGQYPQSCVFTVFGEDRIKQMNIKNGEDLTVQFNIYARQNNGRWFNDLRAYNVIRGQIPQSPIIGTDNVAAPFPPFPVSDEDDTDALPF
jgi:hypothetical protein